MPFDALASANIPPSNKPPAVSNSASYSIYAAAKVWHAPKLQELRDKHGYPIISRWIDLDDNNPIVTSNKRLLWEICLEDVKSCDVLVLYCDDYREVHKGTIMECGHAMALGKPIYCIGKAQTFVASKESDVAFTHHPLWHWTNEKMLYAGFAEATVSFERDYLKLPHITRLF